jgi:hypothetical protein
MVNRLLNAWWLAKRAGQTRSARFLSRAFTAGFLAVRVFILPFFVLAFTRQALRHGGVVEQRVGRPRAQLWAALIMLSMVGGLVWARSLVRGFLKDLRKDKAKKAA